MLRRRTLAVSAAAVAAGVAASVLVIGPAVATPDLPPISAQDLLVKVQSANVSALSGTVESHVDLGIPGVSMGQGQGPRGDVVSNLLTGSVTARVWYAGRDKARVAQITDLSERDAIVNGRTAWTWDSRTRQVVRMTLPERPEATPDGAPKAGPHARTPGQAPPDPAELAGKLVDAVTPSTNVSVRTTSYVAGRSTYELVLAPKAAESTVREAGIAVDAATGLPLRVRIVPKGASGPAVEVGFSAISFATPPDSTFAFSPPADAKVRDVAPKPHAADGNGRHRPGEVPPADGAAKPKPVTVGEAWSTVVILPAGPARPGDASGAAVSGAPVPNAAAGSARRDGAGGDQAARLADSVVKSATNVSGPWGSGRLVSTKLVSVLLLDDGRTAFGAVTPAALEAAVANAPK